MKRLILLFAFVWLGAWTFAQTDSSFYYEPTNDSIMPLIWSWSNWADFDQDGDLDLIIMGADGNNYYSFTKLYLNTDSGFVAVDSTGLPDIELGQMAIADFNGDQYPDILMMGYHYDSDNNVNVYTDLYINNQDLTFSPANLSLPHLYMGAVDITDFDQDGDLDFAITGFDFDNSVYVTLIMINDGNLNFTPLNHSIPGVYYGACRFGDFNGDQYPDLFVSGFDTSSMYTAVWKNVDGDTLVLLNLDMPQVWLGDAQWCDINQDGNLDLIYTGYGDTSYTRNTLIYWGTGDSLVRDTTLSLVGISHSVVATKDFDNDGDIDIFLTGMYGDGMGSGEYVSILYLNNDMDFSQTIMLDSIYWGGSSVADFNGDNLMDIFLDGYKFDVQDSIDVPFAKLYKAVKPVTLVKTDNITAEIYPNPAWGWIKIQSDQKLQNIQVIDLKGAVVKQQKVSAYKYTLPIADLAPGVYLLKVKTAEGWAKAKFIKR